LLVLLRGRGIKKKQIGIKKKQIRIKKQTRIKKNKTRKEGRNEGRKE
jgi:hypothetical protein